MYAFNKSLNDKEINQYVKETNDNPSKIKSITFKTGDETLSTLFFLKTIDGTTPQYLKKGKIA